jgi:hypothetical protein
MAGIDPYSYMRQVAQQMDQLQSYEQIEKVLDEMEYLFEVIPPEMQDPAEELIRQLRRKLQQASH